MLQPTEDRKLDFRTLINIIIDLSQMYEYYWLHNHKCFLSYITHQYLYFFYYLYIAISFKPKMKRRIKRIKRQINISYYRSSSFFSFLDHLSIPANIYVHLTYLEMATLVNGIHLLTQLPIYRHNVIYQDNFKAHLLVSIWMWLTLFFCSLNYSKFLTEPPPPPFFQKERKERKKWKKRNQSQSPK